MKTSRKVYSTHVDEVAYDSDTRQLSVTWDSGKTSHYVGVPPEVAEEAMTSWSVGTFLTQEVKGKYRHTYGGGE